LYLSYTGHLTAARINGIRKGAVVGGIMGFIRLIIFFIYAVGFIYGTRLIYNENSNIGDIFVVTEFFSSLFHLKNSLSIRFSSQFSFPFFLSHRQQIRCDIKVILFKNTGTFLKHSCHSLDEAICAVDSIGKLLDIVRETYMFTILYIQFF